MLVIMPWPTNLNFLRLIVGLGCRWCCWARPEVPFALLKTGGKYCRAFYWWDLYPVDINIWRQAQLLFVVIRRITGRVDVGTKRLPWKTEGLRTQCLVWLVLYIASGHNMAMATSYFEPDIFGGGWLQRATRYCLYSFFGWWRNVWCSCCRLCLCCCSRQINVRGFG